MEQLSLFVLDMPIPGACFHELKKVNMSDRGENIKSFCELMNCWTNCREMQHCTSDGRKHTKVEVEQ